MILINGTCYECSHIDGLDMNEDKQCEEVCGDGIFLGLTNECDDNNKDDGDGCSSDCRLEFGFDCSGGVCKETIRPSLNVVNVDEPNVLVLEFSEEVYISDEGEIICDLMM